MLYIIGISIANIDKLRQFIERRIHCTQFTRTHERARARVRVYGKKSASNSSSTWTISAKLPSITHKCLFAFEIVDLLHSRNGCGGRVHTKKWPIRSHTLTYAWRILHWWCSLPYFILWLLIRLGTVSAFACRTIINKPHIYIQRARWNQEQIFACITYLTLWRLPLFFSYSKYLFNSVVHNFFLALFDCVQLHRVEVLRA